MSVDIKFPSNPENGTVFELIPGVYYKYSAGSNCWVRLKGVDSLGLATPLTDGLMSKEDYTKLQNLVIPPPQSTLKGEDCQTVFKSGTVALYSFDESLDISKNPKVINQTPQGEVGGPIPWKLHRNTAGFDFRLPMGRIKGKRGEPGVDRLDTGPVGDDGAPGINSPFGGTLVTEAIPFELAPGTANRAIVDVTTEEVSDDENYLVVTRANVGNPDACPTLVTPQDFNSALVVALNTLSGGKLIKDETVVSGDCALICRICASSLHHLNIEDLVCDIHDHFVVRINQLKLEKEALVRAWLGTMISLFSEQKAALCCALENCQSRKRNERTRQYIETQRIQAAAADFQLVIDGGADGRQTTPMDSHKNCPVDIETVPPVVTEGDCLIINLDAKIHITDARVQNSNAITTFLGSGAYVAEITDCCANFNASANSPAFSGQTGIQYLAQLNVDGKTTVEKSVLTFPNFGTFSNESAAKNAYQGVTLTFEHNGGDISFWLIDEDGFTTNNAGTVQITIKPLVEQDGGTGGAGADPIYVYRDEISFAGLIGEIASYTGSLTAAENLGDLDNNVNLTFGPPLVQDRAQIFFYDGADGLSLFFVAGDLPSSDNEQVANILTDINITNNSFTTAVRAQTNNASAQQTSTSDYTAALTLNGNSAGFAIGEFDPYADYSIRVDPTDLSTMRTFVAATASGEDVIISEGGSEGIGGNISHSQLNSAPLFNVDNVPEPYGGGNTTGLRINNEKSGQNISISRPIDINIDATFDSSSVQDDTTTTTDEPLQTDTPSKVLKVQDENLLDDNWEAITYSNGRAGSTGTNRSIGGVARQTIHNSAGEPRLLVSTGRPTKSYFGPGSVPALPWDQSYASDQYGNTWVFIRDTKGAHKNGNGDRFIRDAVASETWVTGDRLAANIFPGGSSGIASGTQAGGSGSQSQPANISTFHIFQPASYLPTDGRIQNIRVELDYAGPSDFTLGAALFQDGNKFASISNQSVGATDVPKKVAISAGQSGFGLINSDGTINSSINPNFESGPPVLFGYYTSSTHTSSAPETKSVTIDNFTNCLTVDDPSGGLTPPEGGIPPSIIDEKGEFVTEESSMLPRGTPGSVQDPCVANITISLRSSAPQSARYILTDGAGTKFYSAYSSLDVSNLNSFQLLDLGPTVTALDPPSEFTPSVISGKHIETSVVADQLTASQLEIANSLDGLARLSYIQSVLGANSNSIPNTNNITDIEIEFQNSPFSSIDIGFISADVGVQGAITEVLVDNFEISEVIVGQTVAEAERVIGATKRVVATTSGTDSSATGIIYSGVDTYFGDYIGRDTFNRSGTRTGAAHIDFNGNNFFSLNRAGTDVLSQITSRRGFKNIARTHTGVSPFPTDSGSVISQDAIAVSTFGVVYVADGPAGKVLAYMAANSQIRNTVHGDVNDTGTNIIRTIASGLPQTSNASITIGKTKLTGGSIREELIVNFGGSWFKIDGQGAGFQGKDANRDDTTTLRCCFGGIPPGDRRLVVTFGATPAPIGFGASPPGNSITTDRPINPQPTRPEANPTAAIQAELDRDFNQFNLYVLDDDKIYLVDQNNGQRTLYRDLGEKAFGLRANPRTKDLYYITSDRGSNPVSGTAIRRVDINDLDQDNDNRPKIKTVYNAEDGEGIFGITFANAVPTDLTLRNQTLYAMVSTFEQPDQGKSVTTRLIEVSESIVPPVPSQPISQEIPLSATWASAVSGGTLPGNPSRVIFSRVPPGGGCQMYYKQVQWYERGWRIGACCGALLNLDGLWFIVVKRSVGTDMSCGGGESLANPCISQFVNVGDGHPAIAWPTTEPIDSPPGGGGEEFLGLPTSGFVNFVKDEGLSSALLNLIQSGNVVRNIGNPAQEIPFILFPAS
jgi:hypothetical protein